MKKLFITITATLLFTDCKKEYSCVCVIQGGDTLFVENIRETKKKANDYCKDSRDVTPVTAFNIDCTLYE